MLTTKHTQIFIQPDVTDVLTRFRQEWELAADGRSLVEVQGSVGLILFDLVMLLNFSTGNIAKVLGTDLYAELESIQVVPERL